MGNEYMSLLKLIELSGDQIGEAGTSIGRQEVASKTITELHEMLKVKNGFYAIGGALHVFPAYVSKPKVHDIYEWNSDHLWKYTFGGAFDEYYCFAQDIFGNQFCIFEDYIYFVDVESVALEAMAANLDDWAHMVLTDDYWIGSNFLKIWQENNKKPAEGERLMPKIPFVLGGEYEVSNIFLLDSIQSLRYRGEMYIQLRDLPDGATVQLKTY
ncbi:hypothetical protein [Deinococcus aquaticus]|uniref:hypothetical protein n=1 Tax=Deinococcus aquaticus TaxID=328692 RepID=UPI003F446F0B